MDTATIITMIIGVLGGGGIVTAFVTLYLLPQTRKRAVADTEKTLKEIEKQKTENERARIATIGDLSLQVQNLVAQAEKKDEARDKEAEKNYQAKEKEREARESERNRWHDEIQSLRGSVIQLMDARELDRKNSINNTVKIGALELERERDKQQIKTLREEILRIQKVTGQLELNAKSGK